MMVSCMESDFIVLTLLPKDKADFLGRVLTCIIQNRFVSLLYQIFLFLQSPDVVFQTAYLKIMNRYHLCKYF